MNLQIKTSFLKGKKIYFFKNKCVINKKKL